MVESAYILFDLADEAVNYIFCHIFEIIINVLI